MRTYLRLLRKHIGEASPLSNQEWRHVSRYFTYVELKKHQSLIRIGQLAPYEYWIIKGLVKSYVYDHSEKELIIQFGLEQQWVSDYDAYKNHTCATMHLDCVEDSAFFCLTQGNRELLCQQLPAMANFFRVKSSQQHIALQQRLISHYTEPVEVRYHRLQAAQSMLTQRLTKKMIASYLGISQETLTSLRQSNPMQIQSPASKPGEFRKATFSLV